MKKIKIIALISAFFVFITSFWIFSTSRKKSVGSGTTGSSGGAQSVYVANTDISAFTEISGDMIKTVRVSEEAVVQGAFQNKSDIVGKVANTKIFAGEQLTSSRVTKKDDQTLGMAGYITPGQRAITVSVDEEVGVGNNLRPGYMVDIIFTSNIKDITGDAAPAAQVFNQILGSNEPLNTVVYYPSFNSNFAMIAVQNVKVIAVDTKYENTSGSSYSTVTLETTPEQANFISLLKPAGGSNNVRFTLRAAGDGEIVKDARSYFFSR